VLTASDLTEAADKVVASVAASKKI